MKKFSLLIGAALVLTLVAGIAWSQFVTADDGLVQTNWPSAEDPGLPYYAWIEPAPPHVFDDGEWAAIVFYRDPACVPAGFNLLQFFDVPAAFGCPHLVQGTHLWHGEPFNGSPKIATSSGAAIVWFVPAAVIAQAIQDGELTIGKLAGLEGLLVGQAQQFNEVLHPHPLPPEMGGGGHPNPKLVQNAQGQLEDGRRFNLHITHLKDTEGVESVQIRFR
jgi:hypothetical protein